MQTKTMRKVLRLTVLTCAAISFCTLYTQAQDEPSLGDAARQARQQKQQQPKDPQGKDSANEKDASKDAADKVVAPAKTPRVITNDEIPEQVESALSPIPSKHPVSYSQPGNSAGKVPAETWESQILAVKSYISSLQSDIERINSTIHFASGNCVANCVKWNERQEQKEQQVEQMKAQLEDQKKRLEEMQESARQQGYGSSVYDP